MNAGNPNGLAISSADPSGMGKMFLDVEAAAQRLDVTVGWDLRAYQKESDPTSKTGQICAVHRRGFAEDQRGGGELR
jgi:hypothetical protein